MLRRCLVLAACSALFVTACTKERQNTYNALGPEGVFQHAGFHGVTTRPYLIDPPDDIRIRAPRVTELDGQTATVAPDGNVTYPLIGRLNVAGKSPDEALQMIKDATAKYYVAADMQIDVQAKSKFIYIFGFGADRRGKLPYIGRTTVINVLADSGFNNQGWPQQVWLNRPKREGQAYDATVVVDFKKMAEYGDLTQNYLVEEGDIVFIPYSPLAAWNEKLSRVLGPITGTVNAVQTPANVSRSYSDLGNR